VSQSVSISARFPTDLIREAQARADEEDRSVSWLLRQALKERLEREQSQERRLGRRRQRTPRSTGHGQLRGTPRSTSDDRGISR
jgi:Ribbon-helix-helix protein, copG family